MIRLVAFVLAAAVGFAPALKLQSVSVQSPPPVTQRSSNPADGPVRLGPTGDRLTANDLAQIAALCNATERELWVLVGNGPGFAGNSWYVNVFLRPDRESSRVRRGRIQGVSATLLGRNAYDANKTWLRRSPGEYAQVLLTGSTGYVIDGPRDLNRPFSVTGEFDDDELVGIVSLIRSSPRLSPPRASTTSKVDGTAPIARIKGTHDKAEVSLLDADGREQSGQHVVIQRTGVWTVVSIGHWVVD